MIFSGIDQNCQDTTNLENGKFYYYAGVVTNREGEHNIDSRVIITKGMPRRRPMDILFEMQTLNSFTYDNNDIIRNDGNNRPIPDRNVLMDYQKMVSELITQFDANAILGDRLGIGFFSNAPIGETQVYNKSRNRDEGWHLSNYNGLTINGLSPNTLDTLECVHLMSDIDSAYVLINRFETAQDKDGKYLGVYAQAYNTQGNDSCSTDKCHKTSDLNERNAIQYLHASQQSDEIEKGFIRDVVV